MVTLRKPAPALSSHPAALHPPPLQNEKAQGLGFRGLGFRGVWQGIGTQAFKGGTPVGHLMFSMFSGHLMC